MDIKLITLASYVKPEIVENKNKNWVLNGHKNSFYQYIIDRNNGSATNSSINSTYISLIYGRGLDFKDGLQGVNDWALLQKYLRPQELRKIIADFQIFNEYSVQVIRTKGGGLSSIKHLPKQLVAPSIKNEDGEIDSYWYCENWSNTNKYRPEEFPAFGTSKEAIEIYVGRPYRVGDEYISSPDYLAGLQYAEMEEEISNLNISSIRNGLSAGYIINIPDGKSWGDEEKDEFERQVKKKLTSSSNASNFIISFNGRDVEIDITPFPVNDNIHKQWDFLTKECKTQLMTAHRVISPSLVGLSSASGFSSVADEMDMSEKQTMKRVIKPKQDFIIDGITDILNQFDINLDLHFKPLTEEIEDIVEEIVEEKKEEVKLAGFDPNQKRGADGKWGSGNLNTEKKNCLNKSDLKKKAAKTTAKQVSDYISELNKTKNSDPSRYWSVDSVSKSDAEKSIIIDKPYGAVAVSGEGDIKGLFKKLNSKEKGVGGKLLKDAVSAGGRKLDNFDNYLTKIYLKAGFRVVSRTPFNETYAPDGWVKDLHGTPDVVAMVYDPNKDLDITEKMFSDPSSGYDQMIDYRDKSLVFCGEKDVNLSSQNVDRLISLGEVVGDDWEIIENERCDEITFSEGDLNLIELAQAPKTSNKKSKQDTSLFKVRYQYAGSKKGERDFCNKVIEADKVYREEDLNANYNYNEELSPSGTDSYNIFLFKGGVNCKHWWQRVVYLKKGNDRISVNEARKMILELDPKDRKEASFDKNDKRVAKVAEAQNNYWSLTPNYRDSGVELSAKSKELYQRLAGFDPSQKRGEDGKWGSGGCTFEDWFGNSKIVDSSGEPLEMYHGSTHDFTEFSNVRGNIENDMGIGFYFSSSLDDVKANYDDTDGPDLLNRIDRLAERLQNDLDISLFEATKKAEKKLSGGKTNIIKAFISMNNPLTIGGENDTFLDYNYSEEDGESGLLVDFFENYRMAAAGFYDVEPDRVFEDIEIYDGMMASDFVKAIKANEALAYATDEYGNMASNEILRNTFELMGFDGIVDNTVSRFNMDGVNEDTKHIIAFKPNQIKSVKNKSWCREENNINLSSTKTQKNK